MSTRARQNWAMGGFSTLECLLTAAVASALMSVAVPRLQATVDSARVTTVTNELVSALHLARSEASARGVRVAVSARDGADWTAGWRIYVDGDDDGRFDAERELVLAERNLATEGVSISARLGATSDGGTLSYTPEGVLRRPGSQGLTIGRIVVQREREVRSICLASLRLRTVRANGCTA